MTTARRSISCRARAGLCAFALCLALAAAGCAPTYTSSIRLALDGPPLAVAAQGEASSWHGSMDRGCMAGAGTVSLQNAANGVTCDGEMDHPATDKGRLYADLSCSNGDTMVLAFRNLGPDQGVGIARINPDAGNGERLTLFYHPWAHEARRRLGQVRAEIAEAMEQKKEAAKPADSAKAP